MPPPTPGAAAGDEVRSAPNARVLARKHGAQRLGAPVAPLERRPHVQPNRTFLRRSRAMAGGGQSSGLARAAHLEASQAVATGASTGGLVELVCDLEDALSCTAGW